MIFGKSLHTPNTQSSSTLRLWMLCVPCAWLCTDSVTHSLTLIPLRSLSLSLSLALSTLLYLSARRFLIYNSLMYFCIGSCQPCSCPYMFDDVWRRQRRRTHNDRIATVLFGLVCVCKCKFFFVYLFDESSQMHATYQIYCSLLPDSLLGYTYTKCVRYYSL